MKKTPTQKTQREREPIPFDDALRAMLNAPPSPKVLLSPVKKKTGKQ